MSFGELNFGVPGDQPYGDNPFGIVLPAIESMEEVSGAIDDGLRTVQGQVATSLQDVLDQIGIAQTTGLADVDATIASIAAFAQQGLNTLTADYDRLTWQTYQAQAVASLRESSSYYAQAYQLFLDAGSPPALARMWAQLAARHQAAADQIAAFGVNPGAGLLLNIFREISEGTGAGLAGAGGSTGGGAMLGGVPLAPSTGEQPLCNAFTTEPPIGGRMYGESTTHFPPAHDPVAGDRYRVWVWSANDANGECGDSTVLWHLLHEVVAADGTCSFAEHTTTCSPPHTIRPVETAGPPMPPVTMPPVTTSPATSTTTPDSGLGSVSDTPVTTQPGGYGCPPPVIHVHCSACGAAQTYPYQPPPPPPMPPPEPRDGFVGGGSVTSGSSGPSICSVDGYDLQRLGSSFINSLSAQGSILSWLSNDLIKGKLDTSGTLSSLLTNPIGVSVTNSLAIVLDSVLNVVKDVAEATLKMGPCGNPITVASLGYLTGFDLIEKYIGSQFGYIAQPLRYTMQSSCPLLYPTESDAVRCFLTNTITEQQAKTWIEQQGYCWDPMQRVIQASRSKLGPQELSIALRRRLIGYNEYDAKIREAGYLDVNDGNLLYKLTEQIPFSSDIIRMMVRDAADESIAGWPESDKLFLEKYTGELREWGEKQGIPEQWMKFNWRAHWQLPSAGQLYDMLHRLGRLSPTDPLYTNKEFVAETLRRNDMAPEFVDRLIAVSYKPMTRVDTRRAFEIGAIDRAGVKESYQDQGYDEKRAEILTDFTERLRDLKWPKHREVKMYLAGTRTHEQAVEGLKAAGADDAKANEAIFAGLNDLRAKRNAVCQKSLTKRYLRGEFDTDKLRILLEALGYERNVAVEYALMAQCQRDATDKVPTLATLRQWYMLGLIARADALSRMRNLGISQDDSTLHLAVWELDIAGKKEVEAKNLVKQQEAAIAKQQKAIEGEIKRRERVAKDEQKVVSTAKKASEAATKARLHRTDMIAKAAAKAADDYGLEPDFLMAFMQSKQQELRAEYGITVDQSYQAVILAVERRPLDDPRGWDQWAEDLAQGFEASNGVADVGVTMPP